MTASSVGLPILCTQCGGELHPDQAQVFLTCPFCHSTIYLDKTKVVFHFYLAPTVKPGEAEAVLHRWMSGNDTVKDLDKKAKTLAPYFSYFPVWYLRYRTPNGKETIAIQPAAATSMPGIKNIVIPAGDLRGFDPAAASPAVDPTVPLQATLDWLQPGGSTAVDVQETALVHIPVFHFRYRYSRREYSALVEAATGSVIASVYPEKMEAPYQLVSGVSIGGYLILSLIPIIWAMAADNSFEGFIAGVGLYIALGVPFFVICLIMALFVAAVV